MAASTSTSTSPSSSSSSSYEVIDINEARQRLHENVNLLGIVIESTFPRKSRGTDYFCVLRIVDQSYPKSGMALNFFAKYMELLPRVASGGDIIKLSHVQMKLHNGEVYSVFNKRSSSFALYKGQDGQDLIPYQYSPTYNPTKGEKKLIEGLRKWALNYHLEEVPEDYLSVGAIKEEKNIDLVCKLLHVSEVASNELIAFVWDGTDTPPTSIAAKLEDRDNKLPLQVESFPLGEGILRTFPTVGSVLRLIIEPNVEHGLHLLNIRKWVVFLNMSCKVEAGLWHGVVSPSTRVRYILNDHDDIIVDLQRNYNVRLSKERGRGRMPIWSMPMTSYITDLSPMKVLGINPKKLPFSTLMDVLTCSEVTAEFKCVVRVVAMFPCQVKDIRDYCGRYRFRLTLEDPTARIHAIVYDKDGEDFFDGYPSLKEVERKLNKLLGIPVTEGGKEVSGGLRNPPWIECGLVSYYKDKGNQWSRRKYRICRTKLVC